VKIWKIIFATAVIFTAGFLTGELVSKALSLPKREFVALPVSMYQGRILERMKKELDLNPGQKERVAKIFAENHERMKILWDLINPEVQSELREVREKIRAELNPEQREKFEQLLKQRAPPHRNEVDRVRRLKTSESNQAGEKGNLRTNSYPKKPLQP
jgi:Spy/CpxP family protein refolding chaperone